MVRDAATPQGRRLFPEGRWAMHARSTTIMAQTDRIDDGIRLVNDELMSTLTDIDGCMGTSSWASEEAMRASRDQLQPVRQRLLETMGGERMEVQDWEIALVHRDHESPAGACARVTWGRPPADQLDAAVDAFRTNVLPLMEERDGFCSASMFMDREAGMLCGTISFDSMAAVEATREFAAERRVMMTERAGVQFVDIIECELPIHHLRVPELV
jgi:hypothetical protein